MGLCVFYYSSMCIFLYDQFNRNWKVFHYELKDMRLIVRIIGCMKEQNPFIHININFA